MNGGTSEDNSPWSAARSSISAANRPGSATHSASCSAPSRRVFQRSAGLDAGVVDPHIDVPELSDAAVDEPVDAGSRGEVCRDRMAADAGAQRRQPVLRSGDGEDRASGVSERFRDLLADPL